ncbi:hypothetical protein ABQD56_09870 [Vagococcus fluvialis]|uniref:hypothetical protein n=1 Tax=Vagococcus fluvialis TaxID=2738 RepID=UPI0032E44F31
MGLVISHGAFEGGYIRFNIFRADILKSIGGSFPPHNNPQLKSEQWYWRADGKVDDKFNRKNYLGLYIFLCHSDCDGEIKLCDVKLLKKELKSILPLIEEYALSNDKPELVEMAETLISGCESAITDNQSLYFY